MDSTSETKLFTADDLLELPTGRGKRYELIERELIFMTPAGGKYDVVAEKSDRGWTNCSDRVSDS